MKERWYEKNGELHFTFMWNTGYVSDGMWKKYITAEFWLIFKILTDGIKIIAVKQGNKRDN